MDSLRSPLTPAVRRGPPHSVRTSPVLALLAAPLLISCGGPETPRRGTRGLSPHTATPSTRPVLGIPEPTPPLDPALRIDGAVTEPVELSTVTPVVPEDCRQATVSGIYIFEATIDRDGSVRGVRTVNRPTIVPPCPAYENACRRAIAQWKYRPATLNRTPVPVYLTVTVSPHHR